MRLILASASPRRAELLRSAGYTFEIVVSDTDGKPGNQPLLARPVEIAIEHGDDDAPHWVSAALPAPFTLTAGTRYWLTLQAVSGEATWNAVAAQAAPSTQNSRDGGLSWTPLRRVAATLLLVAFSLCLLRDAAGFRLEPIFGLS